MTNLQEAAIVGRIALQGATDMAPALARKIAEDLPEIFGGNPAKALAFIERAPADALPLSRLVEGFQHNLQKFGLSKTATPTDLFEAAKQQGLVAQTTRAGGRGHTAIATELALGDGNVLHQSVVGGRSLAFRTTAFLDGEGGALSFKSGHYMRDYSNTWRVSTQSLAHEIKLPQQ